MGTVARSFGRFDGQTLGLDTFLGTIAIFALAVVPVLHTPAAMLFLLSGVLLFGVRPARSLSTLIRYRLLLILPLFCVLSTIWSIYPALTLRFGIQLSATMVIAILIADRVPFPTIVVTLFSVLFALVLASIVLGPYRNDTGALVGLFGSKNEMAVMATLLSILSCGLVASREPPRLFRLWAGAGVPLGLLGVLLAQSTGALGYLPFGVCAFVAILLLRRIRPTARILTGLFLFLGMSLIAILIAAYAEAFAALFFDLTGKDVTLTGRVELWEVALNLISERPLLGVGYQAFWVEGHAPAEALWEIFGIHSRSGFSFHNTYLSNAVEIGVIGIAIEALILGAALFLSGRLALKTGARGAALLFAATAMLSLMTLIETPIFFQFSLWTVLVVLTFVRSAADLRSLDDTAPEHRGVE